MSEAPTCQNPPVLNPDQFLTPKQMADYLGMEEKDLQGLRQMGCPYIPIGRGRSMYYLGSVLAWLLRRERTYQNAVAEE